MREGREEHFPLHDQSPIIHRSIPSSKTNTYKASVDTSLTSTRSGSFTPQSLWNRPPAHTHRTHHCRLGPTVNLGIHPRTATHHRHFLTDKTPCIQSIHYHISYIIYIIDTPTTLSCRPGNAVCSAVVLVVIVYSMIRSPR